MKSWLDIYKIQAKILSEKFEWVTDSYQSQFMSHESKIHGNRWRALLAERNLNNLRIEKEYIRWFIGEELKHFQKNTYVLDVGNGTRGRSLQRSWKNPLWDQIPKEEVVCGCHGGGIQVQHRTWTRCHLSGTRTLGQNPSLRPDATGSPQDHTQTSPGAPCMGTPDILLIQSSHLNREPVAKTWSSILWSHQWSHATQGSQEVVPKKRTPFPCLILESEDKSP